MSSKILIGISQCLLGDKVRFNGQHQHNRYITDVLGEYFEYQSFCPEVAVGMGVPRDPIRLVKKEEVIRAVGVKDHSLDFTDDLTDYAIKSSQQLPAEMCGFIFKSKSPTCGMERVKIYGKQGVPSNTGVGLFAKQILKNNPLLPAEEEGRLRDPLLRENFIERVFLLHSWKQLVANGITKEALVNFHRDHKLTLMAHSPAKVSKLGALIADLSKEPLQDMADDYIQQLMIIFIKPLTRKRATNVLQHCIGYFKTDLTKDEKQEFSDIIKSYYDGIEPLIVPITMLNHYNTIHPKEYLSTQTFLNPYPKQLGLRSTI